VKNTVSQTGPRVGWSNPILARGRIYPG